MLDAVRADRVSAYGYGRETMPALDALAAEGVVARNHFALAAETRASLPQLLYSRYFTPPIFPDSYNVPLEEPWNLFQQVDREAVSLPRALAAAGFRTAALSAHAWLRPDTPFAAEFDELRRLGDESPIDNFYGYPTAAQVTDAAITWLDGHRGDDVFLYLHYMDTHFPHPWGPEARAFGGDIDVERAQEAFTPQGRVRDPGRPLADEERRYLDALYDGGLRHADREVGRLVRYLRRRGWLEDTLIVVTSDHGEHLAEVPGRFEHGGVWYDALARVPWIVHYPRRLAPTVHHGLTSSIDVMPTMLSLLDVALPEGARVDGRDLAAVLGGEETDGGQAGDAVYAPHGVRTTQFHLVLPEEGDSRPAALLAADALPGPARTDAQLFDVGADPLETRDLRAARPETARQLLASWYETLRQPFLRHARSRRDTPPEGPFAIAVRHLAVEPTAAVADTNQPPPPGDARWHRNTGWNTYWLAAAPRAPAVTISVELPSGPYELRAAVAGTCRLTVADGPATELAGPAVGALLNRRADPIPKTEVRLYGPARVEDQRFQAILEAPGPGAPCLVRYLGFTPTGTADKSGESTDDRLRALGYVD
ncbi:MAG: sulfatase-like hydrolase/transferase [Thermoanaerobaculia bacterium]